MRGEDDGHSAAQAPDDLPQLPPRQHIQPERRLIQKYELWLRDQRHSDGKPPLPAAGERFGPAALYLAQMELRDRLRRALRGLPARCAVDPGDKLQILPHRQVRRNGRLLRGEIDAPLDLLRLLRQAKAEDVEKNTMTEIALAGKQAVSKIKQEIASLIIAKATAGGVKEAVVDPAFIKEMLVAVAKNWNGADSGKVELQALLPEDERKKLDEAFGKSAQELLAAGIEVGWSKEVKSGFKVGAKEGGYYISFADADIEALLAEYLCDKVFQLLFKA